MLNVDHVSLGKRWNFSNVISPYYRLYYIDDGEGIISSKKERWVLEPGYMYLIPNFTLCNLRCNNYLSQYFIHFFENSSDGISLFHHSRTIMKLKADEIDAAQFRRMLFINPNRKINRSDNPRVYEKNIFYKEYEELNMMQNESVFLETQGILLQLIGKFMQSPQFHPGDTNVIPSKVVNIIEYIQLHLNEKITVTQLAAMANLHPDYFSRLFLKLTGRRPLEYIHERRVERAQFLLVTSDATVSQIACSTGFDNVPHLIKIFRKITNLTPGQYRGQHHNMN